MAKGLSEKAFIASDNAKMEHEYQDKKYGTADYPSPSVEDRETSKLHNLHAIANNLHLKALVAAGEIGDTRGVDIHRQAKAYHKEMSQDLNTAKEFPPRRYNEDSLRQDSLRQDHIVHRNGKWLLLGVHAKNKGKVLGTHPSRESAVAQEAAIKASQARADAGQPRFDSAAFRERMKKFSASK